MGGGVADRFDRKLILVTQLAAVALSGASPALASGGRATAWVVIGFSAALGVTSAFAAPAQQALITSLVERGLAQAVALNSMTFNLARAIGPASAAAVIAALGHSRGRSPSTRSRTSRSSPGCCSSSPRPQQRAKRASLRESFGLLRADPQLALSLVIVMCVGFGSDPVNTESPAFAQRSATPTRGRARSSASSAWAP